MNKQRDQWTSKLGFILAAAGSAVGLGNIWKFPGKAYAGGGGLFLLIYIAVVVIIGLPVMVTELSLGRCANANTVGIFRKLDKRFAWAGWAGVICAAVIFCYYNHVGGWVLRYVVSYVTEGAKVMDGGMGYFYDLLGYDAAAGTTFFPWIALIFAAVFAFMNCLILLKGASGGIEKFNKVGMPALFVILIVLLVRSVTLPGGSEGLKYMLTIDWSKANASTFISALGQAFYSLSLGMAIMTTYGSYLSKKESISKNTALICGLDTLVAFMGGFIIVPAVFATLGADSVGKGGGFAFGALSGVFKAMPAGQVFGVLFYLLLFFAAISSSISIGEGVISFICEEYNTNRKKTTVFVCVVAFLIGSVYTLSQASVSINLPWIDFTGISTFCAGDWMECFTDRLLLPVCALGECIFVGWVWTPANVIKEVTLDGRHKFRLASVYSFLIKYICPIAIVIILLVSFITGTTIS